MCTSLLMDIRSNKFPTIQVPPTHDNGLSRGIICLYISKYLNTYTYVAITSRYLRGKLKDDSSWGATKSMNSISYYNMVPAIILYLYAVRTLFERIYIKNANTLVKRVA